MMRSRSRLILLLAAAAWMRLQAPLEARDSHLCEAICGSAIQCNTECYLTQMDYDNGNPTSCLQYGVYDTSQSCCGDGICSADGEGCANCGIDCNNVSGCYYECTHDWDCGSGLVCNPEHQCAMPSGGQAGGDHSSSCGGTCTSRNDCCGDQACSGEPGSPGTCVVSSTSSCPDSYACQSSWDCYNQYNCISDGVNHCADMYCDPGFATASGGRCQFMNNPACPSESNTHIY